MMRLFCVSPLLSRKRLVLAFLILTLLMPDYADAVKVRRVRTEVPDSDIDLELADRHILHHETIRPAQQVAPEQSVSV